MSQATVCGSHENDSVVMVEGCNMMALIERGLEAPMAGRVAKQYTDKCAEIAKLRAALDLAAGRLAIISRALHDEKMSGTGKLAGTWAEEARVANQ